MDHFVKGLERKAPEIARDIQSSKKEGHWSWMLMPLLREAGQQPSAGTAQYYLDGEEGVKSYLGDPHIFQYYKAFMEFLVLLVKEGKELKMDNERSLKKWLGGTDYHKLQSHIQQFKPLAPPALLRLYSRLTPKLTPSRIKPTPDAFEKEFGNEY